MSDYSLPSVSAENALNGSFDLIDVRKDAARRASDQGIVGADWVDPFELGFGHPVHDRARPVAYFCVHGHEVSNFAAALARVAGQDAYYIRGGFEALRDAGAPIGALTGELGGELE